MKAEGDYGERKRASKKEKVGKEVNLQASQLQGTRIYLGNSVLDAKRKSGLLLTTPGTQHAVL